MKLLICHKAKFPSNIPGYAGRTLSMLEITYVNTKGFMLVGVLK